MVPARVLAGLAAALIALAGCSADEEVIYGIDYPVYQEIQGLEEAADLIIVGEVVNQEVALGPQGTGSQEASSPIVTTSYSVTVQEPIRGEAAAGDTITVAVVGGTWEGKNYTHADAHYPAVGATYAFFLSSDGQGVNESGATTLVNPTQSLYLRSGLGGFHSVAEDNPIAEDAQGWLRDHYAQQD